MTWIKPAVGWGHRMNGEMGYEVRPSRRLQEAYWGLSNVQKAVVVPYDVAKRAGLLRRPK